MNSSVPAAEIGVPQLEGGVSELFDVQVIPGVRHATSTGVLSDEIQKVATFEAETPPVRVCDGRLNSARHLLRGARLYRKLLDSHT